MRPHYSGLDLVRFGAALCVTLYHLGFFWWARGRDATAVALHTDLSPIAPYVSSGWVGVPIFFVLSGFVIAFSASGKSVGEFALGRAARLYPAAWLCAPVTGLIIATDPLIWNKLVHSMALLPWGPWVSGVYWTLAVEIVFYFIVAVSLTSRRTRIIEDLGIVMAVIGSAYWIIRSADFATGSSLKIVFSVFETMPVSIIPISNASHFALGILLWVTTRHGVSGARLGLMTACIIAGFINTFASARFNLALNGEPASHVFIAPIMYLMGIAAIISSIIFNKQVDQQLKPYSSAVKAAGLLTYPLYLVHSELGEWIMRYTAIAGSWLALAISLSGVFAIAALVLRWEKYPRRMIRAVATMRPSKPPITDLP